VVGGLGGVGVVRTSGVADQQAGEGAAALRIVADDVEAKVAEGLTGQTADDTGLNGEVQDVVVGCRLRGQGVPLNLALTLDDAELNAGRRSGGTNGACKNAGHNSITDHLFSP